MQIKLLNEYPQRQMDPQTSRIMLSLLMGTVTVAALEEIMSTTFVCQVMLKRLQPAGLGEKFHIDRAVIAFISTLCTTPGIAVMYAHTIMELAKRRGCEYRIGDLAEDFPHGFPDDAGLREAWDAQKAQGAPGGNYLDTAEAWGI